MGLKEDAMWKMAEKMGMPKSAIEAIKVKQKNGDKSAMPDMGKMMSMLQAMKGDKKDEMRKMDISSNKDNEPLFHRDSN